MRRKGDSYRSGRVDGDIIREAQKELRMGNLEMASYLGVSKGILNRALSGQLVGLKKITEIAKKLDVPVEGLTGKGQISYLNNDTKKLVVGVEPQLDEKLCRITKELNERYGIDDPVSTIRYLIVTYVLTGKVVHLEEGNDQENLEGNPQPQTLGE